MTLQQALVNLAKKTGSNTVTIIAIPAHGKTGGMVLTVGDEDFLVTSARDFPQVELVRSLSKEEK